MEWSEGYNALKTVLIGRALSAESSHIQKRLTLNERVPLTYSHLLFLVSYSFSIADSSDVYVDGVCFLRTIL